MFFDLLHLDGEDLLDRPGSERAAALSALVPAAVAGAARRAGACSRPRLAQGHEGVVVKALDAPYEAGRRGAAWVKVKPVHTLDLVVLGVEWGSGRRRGRLSNLHLGARGPDGGFVMLGKTFKGLTDAMLEWQTEKLLALEERREGHVVFVRPGAGRRDRVRRRPDQPALPGRRRAALRARRPLPGGQARLRGGHARVRARARAYSNVSSDRQHDDQRDRDHHDRRDPRPRVPLLGAPPPRRPRRQRLDLDRPRVLAPRPATSASSRSSRVTCATAASARAFATASCPSSSTISLRPLDRAVVMRGERLDLLPRRRRAPRRAPPARPAPRRTAARARARRSRPRPTTARARAARRRTTSGSGAASLERQPG